MTPKNTPAQPLDLEDKLAALVSDAFIWARASRASTAEKEADERIQAMKREIQEDFLALRSRPEDQGEAQKLRARLIQRIEENSALLFQVSELEAELRALESPQSKISELEAKLQKIREWADDQPADLSGLRAIMVEAPPKGEGEPSARSGLREASPLEEPTDPDLRDFGWAPGDYWVSCRDCGLGHQWADKRAVRCRPCAVKRFKALMARSAPNPSQGEGSTPQSPSRNTQATPETP
jgi:hypothetical protein